MLQAMRWSWHFDFNWVELVLVFILKIFVCCDSHLTLITFETNLKFGFFFFWVCVKFDESLLHHLKVYLGALLIKKKRVLCTISIYIYIYIFFFLFLWCGTSPRKNPLDPPLESKPRIHNPTCPVSGNLEELLVGIEPRMSGFTAQLKLPTIRLHPDGYI